MRVKLAGVPAGTAIGLAVLSLMGALSAAPARATTKVDDGFSTSFAGDGDNVKPANRVSGVRQGSDVYYWVEWRDHPAKVATVRCVIKDSPDGDPLVDHTDVSDGPETEGLTVCGMETDASDFEPGTFYFAQYLDGELIGERSIAVQPRPERRRSVYKEFKYWLGVLAVFILAIGWVVRKMKGGGGPMDPPLLPGSAKAQKAREAVVIGARLGEGLAAQGGTFAATPKTDDAEELRKCGLQYQALAGQADKAKALETGRRYLGLLVKDRKIDDALKVFKECVAIDANFRPERGEDVMPVAKAARASGDAQAAVAILRGFDKIYPGHALVPEVYVFSAKLMAEDLGNAAMARKILEHVVQKYPGHFVAQEAKKYLQAMPQPG